MPAPPARTAISDIYPNPSNATARAGLGAFWDFATGLLGLTGNPAEARTALAIGPVISNRNRLLNARFAINQRAVSGTVVLTAGQYGHDRWKAGAGGCTYTFAASGPDTVITIASGTLIQTVEAANVEGGNYMLSWFGTAQGKIGAGSYGATGVASTSVTANANLNVEFNAGTLSRVQLESGTVVTPFERAPLHLDLAGCKRYFQVAMASFIGSVATSSQYGGGLTLPVEMRATPTAAYISDGPTVAFPAGAGNVTITPSSAYATEFYKQANATSGGHYQVFFSLSAEL